MEAEGGLSTFFETKVEGGNLPPLPPRLRRHWMEAQNQLNTGSVVALSYVVCASRLDTLANEI